jgi:Fe-S oxidoreductase
MDDHNRSVKPRGLERVKKWLYAKDVEQRSAGCVLCGSCYGHGPANPMEDEPGPKEKCPPYEFYRFQRFTPKSRWLMSQRVFHGLDEITPELKEIIYTCSTCLMCQELCGVRNDGYGPWDITVAMREEITERDGPLEAHEGILNGLKQHDNPWGLPQSQRGEWAQGLDLKRVGDQPSKTLLFAGCSADKPGGRPGAISVARLLQHAGEDFVIQGPTEGCCGAYARDLGFRDEYDRQEARNIEALRDAGIKRVITACGSCQRIWKDYPDTEMADIEVVHATEYLERLVRAGRLKLSKAIQKRITYHDPCHLGRGCQVYESPRYLLQQIPGVELVEMPRNRRWSWCCAAGGGVPEAFPDLAEWGAGDRLREASETGAELLVTTSALCERNFLEHPHESLETRNLFELLCDSV